MFSSLSRCKKWFVKRLYTKIIPVDVFVSGTIDQRTYLKNLGGFSPPVDPPMHCLSKGILSQQRIRH